MYQSYKIKKEMRDAWYDYFLNDFNPTHFITINFNRWKINLDNFNYRPYEEYKFYDLNKDFWRADNKDNWAEDKKLEYAEKKLVNWNSRLHTDLLGRNFHKKKKWKNETIPMILFYENISTNLHLHGAVRVSTNIWKNGLEDKINKFETLAEDVWIRPIYENRLDAKNEIKNTNLSICRSGQIWLERLNEKSTNDWQKIISYFLKQQLKNNTFSQFTLFN